MISRPIRCLVTGAVGAGKTTLCYQYKNGPSVPEPMCGMQSCLPPFSTKVLLLLDSPHQASLQVWDSVGIEDPLLGTSGAFETYTTDLSRGDSQRV